MPAESTIRGDRAPGGRAAGPREVRGQGDQGTPVALRVVSPASSSAAPAAAAAFLRPTSTRPVELAAVAAAAGLAAPAGAATTITGVTLRAADVRPGDLFAALPGARVHGADFAATALEAGAAAVLTDPAGAARPGLGAVPVLVHQRPRDVVGPVAALVYGDPTARLLVLGVTGTSGKTTVAHLLEAGLVAAGRTSGLLGTVGNRVVGPDGEPRRRLPAAFTTPEAPDLQALFAVMAEAGATDVAMEVSSHALALGRVAGTRFAVAAFTNLSQDHLDFHRDMEDYFAAKAALFDGRADRAVICVDDVWGQRLAARTPHAVTVSTTGSAGWRATDRQIGADGTQSFTALAPGGAATPVRLQLPGAFNVANALVALACLDAVGVSPAVAAGAFAGLAVPGRMQRVEAGQPFLAVVDYAHKPAAVTALLDTLRGQVPGRLIVVLGCGGDRDRGKRPLMGAAAAAGAELLVVTDDNPRSEDPAQIRAAMLAGARAEPARGEVLEVGDRRQAIAVAVSHARPGDAVVVAGKGHETGQEIRGTKFPFDDAAVLAAAVAARPVEGGARG
jgi:UDP-N-acetylmuramoyl-L-alanyl-D-glutamate--2,6-diaminopimelate ligase